LLAQVQRVTLGAFEHQDVPFARLVQALQPPRDARRNPLFQAFFDLNELETPEERTWCLGEATVTPVEPPLHVLPFELALEMRHGPGQQLFGEMQYSADLFDEATVRRLVQQYRHILDLATHNPVVRLDDLCTMVTAEPRRMPQSGQADRRQ